MHKNHQRNRAAESFILTGPWPEVEAFKKAYFKKYKKSPEVKYEVESWGTIKNFVQARHGIGLVPDYQLFKPGKLKEYEYPIRLRNYQLVALFEKGTFLNRSSFQLIEAFKDYLGEQKKTIS